MKRYVVYLLITCASYIAYGQKRINLLCTDFKINGQVWEEGITFRKSLESIIANIKYPPLIIDRQNTTELLKLIQEETNLSRDFKTSLPALKASNVDYVMFANFSKRLINSTYDLQLEAIKVSGDNSFSKMIFPTLTFTEQELINNEKFRQLLKGLLDQYAFTEDFGVIESLQLEKIKQRLDQKDIEIKSLKTEVIEIKDDANKKNQTINSLTDVVSKMQTENAQKDGEIKQLNKEVTGIKDYTDVSQMDEFGQKMRFGYGLTSTKSELTLLMNKIIMEVPNSYKFWGNDSAIILLDKVISEYPKFPFSYWAKAFILCKKKDINWIAVANKAMDILNVTTSIDGHKAQHDHALFSLKDLTEISKLGAFPLIGEDVFFK